MFDTNVSASCPNSRVRTQAKIRIVIADDHPIFRDGLCRLLSLEADLEVVGQVGDGLHVSEVLQQCDPDILLLDLNMPGLSGLAALQILQTETSRTRVILLTASDNQQEFIQALQLGSCGIVQKQAATDLLITSIRRVNAGELWLDSNTTTAVIRGFVPNEAAPPARMPPPVAQCPHERFSLSARESEIVNLVTQGFKNKDMAEKMSISEQTVKNHLHSIFDKLEVSDRLELALSVVARHFQVGHPPQLAAGR
jgi:DNA-binding NarL/FixJ family response regulator